MYLHPELFVFITKKFKEQMATQSKTDRELVFTRTLKAPRELVFEVWTNPNHVIHWWGPNGFTNTIQEMSVKPGGVWRFMMHGPDGTDYPNKIVFKEVIKPSLLTYYHGWDVEDLKNDPRTFEVTVIFEAKGKTTELTMKMLFKSKEEVDKVVEKYGAVEGNKQTMDKLEEYLHRFDENS
jgi:uncharacterized protein YndB with AHSA1/START domain